MLGNPTIAPSGLPIHSKVIPCGTPDTERDLGVPGAAICGPLPPWSQLVCELTVAGRRHHVLCDMCYDPQRAIPFAGREDG